jgi:hypothetical protein
MNLENTNFIYKIGEQYKKKLINMLNIKKMVGYLKIN